MNKIKIMKKVFFEIGKCAPISVFVCTLCSLVYAVCATESVRWMANLLKSVQTISKNSIQRAIFFALGYLTIQIIRKVFNLIQDVCWNVGVEEKCKYHFRMKLYEKTAKLPYIDFEDSNIYDSIERAKNCIDSMTITQVYMNFLSVIESFITVIGLMVTMMTYSFWYFPIMVVSVLPYLISRIKSGKEFYSLTFFQAADMRKRDYYYSLFSTPVFQKEQRLFGFGEIIKEKWSQQRKSVAEERIAFKSKDSKRLAWCETFITIGYITSIFLSFLLVVNGNISIGIFGAGIFAFRAAQNSTSCFFELYSIFVNGLLETENFFNLFKLKEESERKQMLSDFKGNICVKNVMFTYPNADIPALNIDHLTIKAGERVVIVGENGSGKSTLVKLLLGLYTPETGVICYDGIDVNMISRESLSQNIGAVSQDFVSYRVPIRDNIGIHNPKFSNDNQCIHNVLTKTNLDFISNYDQWLGREFGGLELSGGQWQRLAISGMLCKESKVVYLDEPTSALDPNIEYDILQQFTHISKGKTAIIISHRVGLCRFADKVVFLKNGKVECVGSHNELMKSSDQYSRFYNEQAKWYIHK